MEKNVRTRHHVHLIVSHHQNKTNRRFKTRRWNGTHREKWVQLNWIRSCGMLLYTLDWPQSHQHTTFCLLSIIGIDRISSTCGNVDNHMQVNMFVLVSKWKAIRQTVRRYRKINWIACQFKSISSFCHFSENIFIMFFFFYSSFACSIQKTSQKFSTVSFIDFLTCRESIWKLRRREEVAEKDNPSNFQPRSCLRYDHKALFRFNKCPLTILSVSKSFSSVVVYIRKKKDEQWHTMWQ